ncbi:rubredoxin [Vulcaniibacterium tengchongense]|uniref:Rubredoxin n=2 Tax=Vulcaniibacterium tengchongense TaxID=1273429 RepID=A0A3N4VPL3_9GAMM|nr:rubredoxin [Vulcaniibacterium tengchongense]
MGAAAVGQWKAAIPKHYPLMSEAAATTAYRTWMCVVCGFIYDEAKGLPEEGIAPGTRWEDVPDTWTCPDCGVTKDDFEMVPV